MLSAILHTWKSYTANRANQILGHSGPFWMPESYDYFGRNTDAFNRIVDYIQNNPAKAGLAEAPETAPTCGLKEWNLYSGRVQAGCLRNHSC